MRDRVRRSSRARHPNAGCVARDKGKETQPNNLSVCRRAQETAAALRAAGLMLRRCAWCGAVTLEGGPWERPDDEREVAYLDRHDLVTHGICPSCFDTEMERLRRKHAL